MRTKKQPVSKRARVGKAPSPPSGTVAYERPELGDWTPAGACNDLRDDRHIFDIYANRATIGLGGVDPGALIATIVVNPAFEPRARQRIAWLMSRAPELWRALRNASPYLLDNFSDADAATDAISVLWDAADRWPFEYLHPDDAEEKIAREHDAKRLAGLPQGQIEAKAVKHV